MSFAPRLLVAVIVDVELERIVVPSLRIYKLRDELYTQKCQSECQWISYVFIGVVVVGVVARCSVGRLLLVVGLAGLVIGSSGRLLIGRWRFVGLGGVVRSCWVGRTVVSSCGVGRCGVVRLGSRGVVASAAAGVVRLGRCVTRLLVVLNRLLVLHRLEVVLHRLLVTV